MSPVQKKRLMVIISLVSGISIASALILYALKQNINLFYTPTQLAQDKIPQDHAIRVGGMVVKGSVIRHPDLTIEFSVTDFNHETKIKYRGILPDLFKEGQGVVAQGKIDENGMFKADQVLAKHDENYMPPEVAGMMKGK